MSATRRISEQGAREELTQCSVCGDYFRVREAFQCPRCGRSPLCKKHRGPGSKECVSCTIDAKLNEVRTLSIQEYNISNFIKYIQFVLLFCAIIFIALRLNIAEHVDILRNNIFTNNLIYIGTGAVILYGLFYMMLFVQKRKIAEVKSDIEKIKVRRV
jgi:hypothetical protein